MKLDNLGDDNIENVRAKARLWEEAVRSSDYLDGKLLADTWCAAFVWKKDSVTDFPITEEVLRRLEHNPHACQPRIKEEVQRLANEYHFFHWHLAFPGVFRVPGAGERSENERTGWIGGFDIVLGNPPWERLRMEEKDFFATTRPDIAALSSQPRKQKIAELFMSDPSLYQKWVAHCRITEGTSSLIRRAGLFPLTGKNKFNTASLFARSR